MRGAWIAATAALVCLTTAGILLSSDRGIGPDALSGPPMDMDWQPAPADQSLGAPPARITTKDQLINR